MNILEKYFASARQSQNLKEIGYDDPCIAVFYPSKDIPTLYSVKLGVKNSDNKDLITWRFTAPLKSQVYEWFRDNHRLMGIPKMDTYEIYERKNRLWECIKTSEMIGNFDEAENQCISELIKILSERTSTENQ